MIFLWNPTNEDLSFDYAGLSYTMLSGKRMKVEEAMGKHVLNNLSARGMTRLIFDDDGHSINEEDIALDAVERNKEFKIKQIVTYNERNERRKASGQPYDTPSKAVKQYASELGIDLLQPYTMSEGEKGQIAKLNKENEEKDKQLREQGQAIQDLSALVQKLSEQVSNGFVKAKDTAKDAMVICSICGDEVLASKLNSHMRFKHKEE